ncbi:coiled-coil domain-containing protein 146 [Salarias fasciatus]|uniref:coiled-coil domain-containing protein 146 n=1 Tax=Salarias fasciatus TaxID=181472 RepID=UPI001176C8DE|nr:coiled-coil domain-containing protein 146 [Salarias fasciatus]
MIISSNSARDCEVRRLGEAKRRRAELERLRAEVESTEEPGTAEEAETEVKELRRRLLRAGNQLKAAEERDYQTQHQLKCLWEEKRCLEKENQTQTQTQPAELEDKAKAIQDQCEDLRKEIAQRRLEIGNLLEDVEISERQISKEQKELEDKKEIIEFKEAEKARLISVPDQILKEAERKRTKKEAAAKKIEELNVEITESEQRAKRADERNRSLKMKGEEVTGGAEGLRRQVEEGERKHALLLRAAEVGREEARQLLCNRSVLEMKLQNVMCDRKYVHESQSAQLREKNRQMQALKSVEQSLATSAEQLERSRAVYSDLQAQLDAVPKREAGVQRRLELQKEVDALRASFENRLSVAEEESREKRRYGRIQELLRESNCLREELHNLRCLTQIKAEERGQKHRERLRAEQLNQHIQQELREKDLICTDQSKLQAALQRRISAHSKLYDAMVEEKNKYVGLKQISSQTIAELSEQIKVLQNEMEIQRTIVTSKDRSSIKARMKLSHISKTRDKLRNDISKVTWKHRELTQEFEDSNLELLRLNQMIGNQEEALMEMNKEHETAVQQRNSLGLRLLEHDEVLSNYREKHDALTAAIREGSAALEASEEDIRDLQLAISEEKRQIDLKEREVPLQRELEGEITTLHIELSEARDKTLRGLNRTVNYKQLEGKDPPSAELVKKIEQLEVNVAERERQLLEKELLQEQVTRLSKALGELAENRREDTLSLAKQLNDCQADIININQRLRAVSAELSMKRAIALSQQQQIKEKELQMDRCQRGLEDGLPPHPELEEEWRRTLRDKRRRQRDRERRKRRPEEEEWNQLPNGVYTTAEPRPNAYIPQNDLLPLPRPYGAQAPFKASQPGANMRHIRKPTLKP